MSCFGVFRRMRLVIHYTRFTYGMSFLQYVLHFPVVVCTFSTLDLCDTVVKAGGVTITHSFSDLFWDKGSNLGGAWGKLVY